MTIIILVAAILLATAFISFSVWKKMNKEKQVKTEKKPETEEKKVKEEKKKIPAEVSAFFKKWIPRLILAAVVGVGVFFIHGWVTEKQPNEVANIIGRIDEDTTGYRFETEKDKSGNMVKKIKMYPIDRGTFVRLLTVKEKDQIQLSPSSEKMVEVMTRDGRGNYVEGYDFFLPPRNVNWDWEREDAARAKAIGQKPAMVHHVATQKTSPTIMKYRFNGEEKNSKIIMKRLDDETAEFVMVWNNGHEVFFSGQKYGKEGNFKGLYRHTLDGKEYTYEFALNPKTMSGEFEQRKGSYIFFQLL